MRDAALEGMGGTLSTVKIAKCKKLFNHLRKCFDRTLIRAFLNIDNYEAPSDFTTPKKVEPKIREARHK